MSVPRVSRSLLLYRALCAKGLEGGGVYTSSDPCPPAPQVFLNFLVGIWSKSDVEIVALPPQCRRSVARLATLVLRLVGAMLLARLNGRRSLVLLSHGMFVGSFRTYAVMQCRSRAFILSLGTFVLSVSRAFVFLCCSLMRRVRARNQHNLGLDTRVRRFCAGNDWHIYSIRQYGSGEAVTPTGGALIRLNQRLE